MVTDGEEREGEGAKVGEGSQVPLIAEAVARKVEGEGELVSGRRSTVVGVPWEGEFGSADIEEFGGRGGDEVVETSGCREGLGGRGSP